METELEIALIAFCSLIFTSLVALGVSFYFRTKSFEEEHEKKIERIINYYKVKLDSYVLDIVKEKMAKIKKIPTTEIEAKNWQAIEAPVFADFLHNSGIELVSPRELDAILVSASSVDIWADFIMDNKIRFRRIGIVVILMGIGSILSLAGYYYYGESVLFFTVLGYVVLSIFLFFECQELNQQIKRLEKTYSKINAGIDIC